MRRLGTEGWAGVAMLVVAVAVALPALLGLADPVIPRLVWAVLLMVFVLAVLATEVTGRAGVSRAALLVAVLASWALVLTVPGLGLLHVIVVITAALSVFVVSLPTSVVLAVLNTGVVLLASLGRTGEWSAGLWPEALMLSGFYLLIQVATVFSSAALRRAKQMRRELARAHVALQAAGLLRPGCTRTAEPPRAAERLRISRELHDLIGHQLTVLTLNLEAARHLEADAARRHVDRADEVARGLLRDVRATVGQMRARPTDLQRALEDMAGGIPGLAVDIAVDPELDLGEDEQAAFIRLAPEAVTTTIRHSYATRLQIDLACEDGQVTLVARDDGVGAHTSELGNGLQGLRERFEDLGGELTVDGRHGFAVTGRLVST